MTFRFITLPLLICPILNVSASVYYDVQFSSPLNTVDSTPTVNASIFTPSQIGLGSPQVVANLNGTFDQPALFNSAGNVPSFYYDQLIFDLGQDSDTYHMGFDVQTDNLIGSENVLNIVFNMPYASTLSIRNDGLISPVHFAPSEDYLAYTDGTPLHIDISVDIPNNRRVVLVNNIILYDDTIHPSPLIPGDLSSISINFGRQFSGGAPDTSSSVAIDNILIDDGFIMNVPEPATTSLLLASFGIYWFRQQRQAE